MALHCIASWNKYLPDYEQRLWNEDSFDISQIRYVKEAYDSKKYAFVSDYVRLYALSEFGGIYLDTDVEVLKSLDPFLQFNSFSGFESEKDILTGIIGSEKNGLWVKEQLKHYENRPFILPNGKLDLTTNVQITSRNMAMNGLVLQNIYQVYKECFHVFPKDYFCPKSRTGIITITQNTYCIHHFTGSWQKKHLKFKRYFFQKIIGPKNTDWLVRIKKHVKSIVK